MATAGFRGLTMRSTCFSSNLNWVLWLAYDERGVSAVCVVCYAISTSMGAVVAKLDDVSVKATGVAADRDCAVGTPKRAAQKESVTRIDVGVHLENPEARKFYERLGFVALNEERMACVI